MSAVNVSSRVVLNKILLGPIRKGGYVISYDGSSFPGEQILLGFPDLKFTIDVTGRNSRDLLDADDLPQLLSFIGAQKLWGAQGRCRLYVTRGGVLVGQSHEQIFDCPVQPYFGRLCPELGKGDAGPKLQYTGISNGRMLYHPSIGGRYYFSFAGKFETENKMRGLNCITYAGAVFGVDPAQKAMSGYGTQLANFLNAQQCGLENKTGQEIKKYFIGNPRGTYLMWSATHTVIIVDGVVHEFSHRRGGYVATDIQQWGFGLSYYWVRKTIKQF